jgi:hypothetical protein
MRRPVAQLGWLLPALLILQLAVLPVLGTATPAAAAVATSGQVDLRVREALRLSDPIGTAHQPITEYKWLIAAEKTDGAYGYVPAATGKAGYDAVGDPTNNAGTTKQCTSGAGLANVGNGYDPNACQWPSVRYTPGAVPVVAEGDQSDFAPGPDGAPSTTITLKPGRYLISVTADGHKIDGAHFDVDGTQGTAHAVVDMYAYPLPTGTLRLRVFKDTAPVDGTYEVGSEAPLRGFHAHLGDVFGEVTTDFYGNKLCTNYVHDSKLAAGNPNFTPAGGIAPAGYSTSNYDINSPVTFNADGTPQVDPDDPGGTCTSDAQGDVVIPYLGPDRYTATVIAPSGQKWYQTTTLEGNHDWDMWIAEAESGFDSEMTMGGEPVPPVDMGYVPYGSGDSVPANGPSGLAAQSDQNPSIIPTSAAGGSITGVIDEINAYVGGSGGVNVPNSGVAGANVRGPVADPIITLSDLGSNDQMVYVGRGAKDGTFTITGVPDGDYQLTAWDYNQDLILDSFNVTVNQGKQVDVGQKGLVDWYADIKGTVFIDANANGKRDPGEVGVPKFPIAVKQRDNSLLDAGQNAAQTDNNGNYEVREGYPISKWFILEAFSTKYKTTGITVQADNEPTATTYQGGAVDVSIMPIIGLSGRVDWGVQTYAGSENGGIAATVSYDTTRNELDPANAVSEGYQPGIPGLTMHLYYPLKDPDTGKVLTNADGSAKVLLGTDGKPLDVGGRDANADGTYTTETWDQPTGCTARQHDGTPLTDQSALPPFGDDQYQCTEAPMLGWQGVPSDKTDGAFGQTVNGNYAFASLAYPPADLVAEATSQAAGAGPTDLSDKVLTADASAPITNDDFVVKVDIPELDNGQPLYQVTKEEDVNVFDGDTRMPQENFPLPTNTTPPSGDVGAGSGAPVSQSGGIVSACVGADHDVKVTDGPFLAGGGSPFQDQSRNLCDEKLITVRGGQAVAPNFNLFTPVPLPTHFWGLTINDLGLSQDKSQAGYGEAQPLPNVPMGIYDWAGRLVDTVSTDWNGMYEALEPSTSSYNCPLPAGPCPGMYYFKGNDPGQPGHVNANYNPRFRTIGTEFQAWPGLWTVTDTAPTQVGVIAGAPGSAQLNPVQCDVNAGVDATTPAGLAAQTPDLYSATPPYLTSSLSAGPPVSAPGQTLPISRTAITGTGTTRTVTLTTSGVNTAAGPAYVQLPLLTTANAGGPGRLSTAQLNAINTTGTVLPGGAGSQHPITGKSGTSITFALPVTTGFTGTGNAGVPVSFTATTPASTMPGPLVPSSQDVVINGTAFGPNPGSVTITPLAGGTSNVTAAVTTWGNNQIKVTVKSGTSAAPTPGAYRLSVKGGNGREAVNGLTVHVLGGNYTPRLIQVNPPTAAIAALSSPSGNAASAKLNYPSTAFPAVTSGDPNTSPEDILQKAVDKAATYSQALVVVWPNAAVKDNPTGDYFENVIVHSNVKIQGIGPGGGSGAGYVPGSRINGLGFNPDNRAGAAWVTKVGSLNYDGPANVPDAAVVTYVGRAANFNGGFTGALDGFTVTGGSQSDFAANVNAIYGDVKTPAGAAGALVTQGGGIYLHASANNVQISDNIVVGNSGSYAGGIRVGTPYTAVETSANTWSTSSSRNTGVTITHNRIRDNGGTNLAGGVGIFDGSNNYTIDHNDLCGNFSSEYGGAISHYGLSTNGTLSFNRVYLNQSYDEGGGVLVAGELNPNLAEPSAGAGGSLLIDANQITDNLANDDGGGLRFLQAGRNRIDVKNNIVSNNISAHEGGGIALDDSVNVHLTGNTIVKNLTTATAITSDGQPAPAGLSTALNSDQLQATLGPRASKFSEPQDFRDNIFFQNLAGRWDPTSGTVRGINPGNPATDPKKVWEMGSVDAGLTLTPTYSILSQYDPGVTAAGSNKIGSADNFPQFATPYDVNVSIVTSRLFPSFREAVIVANAVAPNIQGNYHLATATSPANTSGAPADASVLVHDVDGRARVNRVEIGADELPNP